MSIRRALVWSMSGQWLVFAFNFAVSVVIARYLLPPSAMGTFSVGFAAAAMISMLQDFGLSRYIVRAEQLTDAVLDTCATITLCMGVAICFVIAALSWPVAWYYAKPELTPIMLLIGAGFLLLPLNTVPAALLQRAVDFRSLALINLAAAVANAAVSVLFALEGYGPVALAFGFLAQQVARALVAVRLGPRPIRFRLSFAGARPVVSFGSGTTVLAVNGGISARAPDLVIGSALGMHAVGLFGRAAGMAEGLRTLLDGGLASVFYSHFAQLVRDRQRLDRAYLNLVECYTSVMWPAMLALSLLASPIVTLIYGDGWTEAGEALRWVALSEMVFFAMPLHTEVPLLTGHLRQLIVRNLVETVAAVLTLLVLARYGLAAAAASRLLYGLCWFVIYFGLMRRIIGFSARALFTAHLRSAAATLAAIAPVVWLTRGGSMLTLAVAAQSIVAGGCLWLAALIALRHPTWGEVVRIAGSLRPWLARPAAA